MMKLTESKRGKLRKAAEAAKKAAGGGVWTRWAGSAQVGRLNRPGALNTPREFHGETFVECEHSDEDFGGGPKSRTLARFVAAADPDTVLAMLDAIEESEKLWHSDLEAKPR